MGLKGNSPISSEVIVKVLLANKFFFLNGGSEAVMFQERKFLGTRGLEVVDFSMKDERNLDSPFSDYFVDNQSYGNGGGLADMVSALKLIHSPEAVGEIGRLMDETRPDLVHCHNIYHQLTPSIIGAAKKRGLPVMLTLHDYKPICPVYTRLREGRVCSECLDNRFSRVLKYRCADGSLGKSVLLYAEARVQRFLGNYEKVDLVVAPSEFMKGSVAGHRFQENTVRVLYNGVDTKGISPALEDGGYVLYLGRLAPEKGVETLLAAHTEAQVDFRLVVAGTGPLEGELHRRYPAAQYMGHVAGAALAKVVRGASLIVIPSEWYENCPMSVLEAMAYGKPVVAADIGGIPELVAHEQTGLLFAPGDRAGLQEALVRLMGNADLRRVYGAAGRKKAEECFSLERHNSELLALYLELLDHSQGAATRPISHDLATPQE